MVELDIGSHFAALHQFILLQDGEFAQNLTDQLFDKVCDKTFAVDLFSDSAVTCSI
jgi:hypothetical protein